MAEWYYRFDGVNQGPVSEADLKHIFDSGALSLNTPVWSEGMENWVEARTRPEIFHLFHQNASNYTVGSVPTIKKNHNRALIVTCCICFLGIVLWAINAGNGLSGADGNESIAAFREKTIANQDQWLARTDNPIRQKIENAHMTVTAKSASVTSCFVKSIDGSDNAGKNGSNVGEIDVVYTVIWDGIFQKDGFTEFEVDYDSKNKIVKETRYLRSSALFNADTVDWVGVGFVVGEFIAEHSESN